MTARAGLRRIANTLARLARSRRGNVGMMTAFFMPILVGLVFAAIDVNRAMTAKQKLQDGLDAATLIAARSTAVTNADLQALGSAALNAQLSGTLDGTLTAPSFTIGADGQKVLGSGEVEVPAIIMGLFGQDKITVHATSEVTRASYNVEVALALDTTGSMSGQPISDLKVAAKELVDVVVQDVQTPFYSKVALVPYSMAVNAGTYAQQVRGAIANGTCTAEGCQKFKFTNTTGWYTTQSVSTCVTERSDGYAFTDAAPTTSLLGRNYPSADNPCLANTIVPLSSDRTALKSSIDSLAAGGSTAGHIGAAWGWYMVSPNFGYLWPAASRPAAYGTSNLLKVVVLLTDGEFNTAYCHGVVSQNSNAVTASEQINCVAPKGTSSDQALKVCDAMKAQGVIVYTVGFNVSGNAAAKSLLQDCASDASHYYEASSGVALKDAFHAIGKDISRLRISR